MAKQKLPIEFGRWIPSFGVEFGTRILWTLLGILFLYLIVFVGVLTRNELKKYSYIGHADRAERTITLEAKGKTTATPDIATISLGMRAEKSSVEQAQQENTKVMNALLEGLKKQGIEKKDTKTSNYYAGPVYSYSSDGRNLEGYAVSQDVLVKIRDIQKAGDVLALAGQLGINSIGGLEMTTDDSSAYLDIARQDALANIAEQKRVLEKTVGISFGDIVGYAEFDNPRIFPMRMEALSLDGLGGGEIPVIEPGLNDVEINVQVTYEIR